MNESDAFLDQVKGDEKFSWVAGHLKSELESAKRMTRDLGKHGLGTRGASAKRLRESVGDDDSKFAGVVATGEAAVMKAKTLSSLVAPIITVHKAQPK